MKNFITIIFLLILLLIFHNETITGTQNGLLLWYQTLIPSLLPFLLLTNALSETNSYQAIAIHSKNKHSNYTYTLTAVFLGNLCGYPIGGKILNDFVKNNYLSPEYANQILSICSQASPMFLIGYVHLHILKGEIPLGIFLFSIYFPIIVLLPFLMKKNALSPTSSVSSYKKMCICDTFMHTVQTMVMIGLYIVIFSIIIEIVLSFHQPTSSKILLSFLEITNGLKLLEQLPLPQYIELPLLCALSAFGGLCSAFQIKGVLNYLNANIKKYLLHKFILSTGTFCIIFIYLLFT